MEQKDALVVALEQFIMDRLGVTPEDRNKAELLKADISIHVETIRRETQALKKLLAGPNNARDIAIALGQLYVMELLNRE